MQQKQSTRYQKILVSYLYFIQGIFLQLPATTILTYKQMPSYSILGLFSIAVLPFSIKFISAPFIEKFTSKGYGRRKTWVIVSFIGSSLLLFLATFFIEQSQSDQQKLAMILTGVIFMVSLEDISTDALAVKELNDAQLTSYLQCIMQSIGGVVGSIVYFQLVSGSLYKKLGFTEPFLTISEFFCIISGLVLVSALVIHLSYNQKLLKQQMKNNKHTFWQIILHYRYFIIPKYMLCRRGITFIIYIHGLNYFLSSYIVQQIKKKNITKDQISFLSNVMIIPVFILLSFLKKYWVDKQKNFQRTRLIISSRLLIAIIFFTLDIESPLVISIFTVILTLLAYAQFFINSIIINSIADTQYSGMFVTMMASLSNFGNNTTIHLKIIDMIGYGYASIIGFIYTGIIVCFCGKINQWVLNGSKNIDENQINRKQKIQ